MSDLDVIPKLIIKGEKYISLKDYADTFSRDERNIRRSVELGKLESKKIKHKGRTIMYIKI